MITLTITTAERGSFDKVIKLWCKGADVVFCAGKFAFCVSKEIICAQSEVFKDIFSRPQSEAEVQIMLNSKNKSFRLIFMDLPDNETDLFNFFEAIFNKSYYCPLQKPILLHKTVSILRLAYKYNVPSLVWKAVEHLDVLFPLDHDELLRGLIRNEECFGKVPDLLWTLLDLIQLAHNMQLQWIIPCVKYVVVTNYHAECTTANHPRFATLTPSLCESIAACSRAKEPVEIALNSPCICVLQEKSCIDDNKCQMMSQSGEKRKCQDYGNQYRFELEASFWKYQCLLVEEFEGKSLEDVKDSRDQSILGNTPPCH